MKRVSGLLIGDVAERAGVSAPTIRYYEDIRLLPKPSRSAAGYRRYSESTIDELRFIRKAQALGFSLDEVAEILELLRSGKVPCSRVRSLAHQHLAAVEERIRQLEHFRKHLATELAKWDSQETGVTCGGLCQFISDSEQSAPGAEDVAPHLKIERRKRRERSVR